MVLRFFRQSAAIDLVDTHAVMDGGVHIAALGGIWMLAVFGFAGLSLRNDGLTNDPRLPKGWRTLTLGFNGAGAACKSASTQASRPSKRLWKQARRWSYS